MGFAIAAPVGPIGVLCIQRSLQEGFKMGLMTGLGAALADGTYGLIAGLGLTVIATLLITHAFWIRLVGGIFLLYLGMKIFLTSTNEKTTKGKADKSSWHAFVTTYFLTLTNPMTVLSFIAIFAGLGLVNSSMDYSYALILVLGITLGSAIWWLILSGSVALILHHKITPLILRLINRLSGLIILAFGIWALLAN